MWVLVVALGAALLVVTAVNQPYNQNEWVQLRPYDKPDLGEAIAGTRQPPLDPLLGVLVQRLLGEGHLLQRLVPVVSGVGSLVCMAVLLRRLGLGWAGPLALLFMSTAPLFLRYSAYTRPYALPVTLMLLCAVAGSTWMDSGRRRWLVVAVVTALVLPLSRVPEPSVFLVVAATLLAVEGGRRVVPRARAWPLAGGLLLGLVTVGLGMLIRLAAQSETRVGHRPLIDVDPSRVLARLRPGAAEIWNIVVPEYLEWFPWWPLTLLLVLTGLALPASRRRLFATWYWWALALAPLVFLVVFHTLVPLDLRDYTIRFAYFAVPPLTILVGVVGHVAGRGGAARQPGRLRWVGAALVTALVLSQLPATWRVLTEDEVMDLEGAGRLMANRVPAEAVVLFDGPGRTGHWRQRFFGKARFLDAGTTVVDLTDLARGRPELPAGAGPVWLLIMDAECVSSVACDLAPAAWDGRVEGFRPVGRPSHLTLHAPTEGQRGLSGVLRAMQALVRAYGPERSVLNALLAARILSRRDRVDAAAALLAQVCRGQPTTGDEAECRTQARRRGLGSVLRRAEGPG